MFSLFSIVCITIITLKKVLFYIMTVKKHKISWLSVDTRCGSIGI